MQLSTDRSTSSQSLFKQGRWEPGLVSTALAFAQASEKACDWVTYLNTCLSIEGVSSSQWQHIADHYATSTTRSPKLLLTLANLATTPGLLQNYSTEDRRRCQTILSELPQARSRSVVLDTIRSGYLGTHIAHYPHLLASDCIFKPPAFSLDRRWQKHRTIAAQLLSLQQPFPDLINQTLGAHKVDSANSHSPRISVVGNSPVILTQTKGLEIDSADVVIRFNHASHNTQTQEHTGKRTDLWVMSPSTNIALCPADAQGVIVTGVHSLERASFYWRTLPELKRPLSQAPTGIWHALVELFCAPPSAGTLLLASLKAMSQHIDIRCYGFTTNEEHILSSPNHHADNTPRSKRHNWQAEARWMAENFR